MRACFCVSYSDVADAVDGESIVETTVVAEDAAVAVRGVFAETDIGDNEQGGESGAEEANGLDDRTIGVVGRGAQGIFHVGSCGYTEKDDGAETFADERFEVRDEFVDSAAMLVGKRGNERFFLGGIGDEERVDEHRLSTEVSLYRPKNKVVW